MNNLKNNVVIVGSVACAAHIEMMIKTVTLHPVPVLRSFLALRKRVPSVRRARDYNTGNIFFYIILWPLNSKRSSVASWCRSNRLIDWSNLFLLAVFLCDKKVLDLKKMLGIDSLIGLWPQCRRSFVCKNRFW